MFGATVVDRASMRAWKLSEIDRELLPLIQEAARKDTGRWAREAQERREEWIARKRAEHVQDNMDLAASQAGPREITPTRGGQRLPARTKPQVDWFEIAVKALLGIATGGRGGHARRQGGTGRRRGP